MKQSPGLFVTFGRLSPLSYEQGHHIRSAKCRKLWKVCPIDFPMWRVLLQTLGLGTETQGSVRDVSFEINQLRVWFYDSSRGLTRPSSGQTTSLQCCPDAGSNLSCETISGPVEEDRGWGKCFLVGNGQHSCLVHARRTEGSSSTFKKKGKLPVNSTMRDNFTKRFQLMIYWKWKQIEPSAILTIRISKQGLYYLISHRFKLTPNKGIHLWNVIGWPVILGTNYHVDIICMGIKVLRSQNMESQRMHKQILKLWCL